MLLSLPSQVDNTFSNHVNFCYAILGHSLSSFICLPICLDKYDQLNIFDYFSLSIVEEIYRRRSHMKVSQHNNTIGIDIIAVQCTTKIEKNLIFVENLVSWNIIAVFKNLSWKFIQSLEFFSECGKIFPGFWDISTPIVLETRTKCERVLTLDNGVVTGIRVRAKTNTISTLDRNGCR